MREAEQYHNIPSLLSKIQSRISQSSTLIQSTPSKYRVELQYFISSISNCISVLKQETIFLTNTNQELEHIREINLQKITSVEHQYLTFKLQANKDILQLQNKNHKLVKEVEFLSFIVKGLKEELNQSKVMISNVKEAGMKRVNNIIRDVEDSVRRSAEKICGRMNAYRQESHIFTVHTEEDEVVQKSKKKKETKGIMKLEIQTVEKEKQKQREKQKQKVQKRQKSEQDQKDLQIDFFNQMTQFKKPKKAETKLAKILKQQARRAEMQQKQYYLQANQN